VEYSDLLKELIGRGYVKRPQHVNDIFKTGEVNDDIMTYILQSTKSITPSD